jgi:hypothetical protein
VLPPLQNKNLKDFNPADGSITKESDRVKIRELMSNLDPYLKWITSGYEGERGPGQEIHRHGQVGIAHFIY